MTQRTVQRVIASLPTSDGAGVKLRRSIGQSQALRVDPFLMLDHFSTEDANDYIAGFPSHPHRGFETVTYILDGHMQHRDHLGNVGELKSGGVQWMTAGRGVIHSEMPQQDNGRMRGFQLWVNLPAREKMKPAAYRDIPADRMPTTALAGGGRAKVIAGSIEVNDRTITGPIAGITTEPMLVDVELTPREQVSLPVTRGHNAFVYVFEGEMEVRAEGGARVLTTHQAGVLSDGDSVELTGGAGGGRAILVAGKPLNEPVVQYGPFVMNTREEIEQAMCDYQSGTLTQPA